MERNTLDTLRAKFEHFFSWQCLIWVRPLQTGHGDCPLCCPPSTIRSILSVRCGKKVPFGAKTKIFGVLTNIKFSYFYAGYLFQHWKIECFWQMEQQILCHQSTVFKRNVQLLSYVVNGYWWYTSFLDITILYIIIYKMM